jgi:PAS domain-containing protein
LTFICLKDVLLFADHKLLSISIQFRVRLKDPVARKERQKERNRTHAKVSRLRKKFFITTLEDKNRQLVQENLRLQKMVQKYAPQTECQNALALCENRFDAELNIDPHGTLRGIGSANRADSSMQAVIPGDFSLLQMLTQQSKKTSFLLTDPKLPDNPIVFVSEGFMDLTGYGRQEVCGRNCRFLQGPNTEAAHVQTIRDGIKSGNDTAVMLTNYKKDGTSFREC